jgi:hypothetical protein
MVDDEGVDIVFNVKGTPKTLAVQVKSRFASSALVQRKRIYRAQVRRKVFRPREDLYLLFVLFDDLDAFNIDRAWLIPSLQFQQMTANQSPRRPNLVFAVNIRGKNNIGTDYLCSRQELANRVAVAIEEVHAE